MRDARATARWTVVLLAMTILFLPAARATGATRTIAVLPFDASALERESQLPSEKDWVDVARQHLRKLKGQIK